MGDLVSPMRRAPLCRPTRDQGGAHKGPAHKGPWRAHRGPERPTRAQGGPPWPGASAERALDPSINMIQYIYICMYTYVYIYRNVYMESQS